MLYVHPARQLPLLPHLWARECFCGFMGRLSDGAIGGAVRRPALELHHSDENGMGSRGSGVSGGKPVGAGDEDPRRIAAVGTRTRWQGAVRRRD